MKKHRYLLLLIVLSLSIIPLKIEAEESASGDFVEIEEGIYQVLEDGDEQELYVESGDGVEPTVDESSTGSDNGEDNNSGQYSEQSGQEGNYNTDAGTTETVNSSNGESETVEVIDLTEVENKLDTVHEDLLKIMISIWALCGLFLGTKLIRSMFGYG